jgi:response regulator RpfG family c-di-GMP phosphodiesterase
MKIFICEQDPYRAKLIQDILGIYNYKIITVKKHTDLFKKAYSQKPAVIVMNEVFAKQSGLDILTQLRSDPLTSHIPIIYISNEKPLNEQLRKHDFDELTEIVQEPIKIKNLRHYIDRWTTFRSLYIRN